MGLSRFPVVQGIVARVGFCGFGECDRLPAVGCQVLPAAPGTWPLVAGSTRLADQLPRSTSFPPQSALNSPNCPITQPIFSNYNGQAHLSSP